MSTNAKVIEAGLHAKGMKTAIIASRFNNFIVEKLVDGALDALVRHGADAGDQSIVWVPGAWEVPLAAQKLAQRGGVDAIIAVGAVIKGGTPHFDYVAAEVGKGIASVSLQHGLPITNGVLTTNTLEQSIERAGSKMGNKGWEAATAAIEMVNLSRELG
jgi:6,7-dimethyl-8-ribityllumazine synthase